MEAIDAVNGRGRVAGIAIVLALAYGPLGQTFCLIATRLGLGAVQYRCAERHSDRNRLRDRRHNRIGAVCYRRRRAGLIQKR